MRGKSASAPPQPSCSCLSPCPSCDSGGWGPEVLSWGGGWGSVDGTTPITCLATVTSGSEPGGPEAGWRGVTQGASPSGCRPSPPGASGRSLLEPSRPGPRADKGVLLGSSGASQSGDFCSRAILLGCSPRWAARSLWRQQQRARPVAPVPAHAPTAGEKGPALALSEAQRGTFRGCQPPGPTSGDVRVTPSCPGAGH